MSASYETSAPGLPTALALPAPAVRFVAWTTGLALLVIATAWTEYQPGPLVAFGIAALAAILCGSRSVRISPAATISLGFVVVFGVLVHVGLPEACVVAALSGLAAPLLSSERHPRPPAVTVFAVASVVVSAWIAGTVFQTAGGEPGTVEVRHLALPAMAAATTYLLVNSMLVAGVARLASGVSVVDTLRVHLGPATLAFYAGSAWVVVVHVAWCLSGMWVLLAAIPPLYAIHLALLGWARGHAPATDQTVSHPAA